MTLHEPATFATDLLLAAATAFWGARLWRQGRQKCGGRATRLFGAAFWASSCGALTGGLYHALPPDGLDLLRLLLWKGTVWAIGLAGVLLVMGAGRASLPDRLRGWLAGVAVLQFVGYALWMVYRDDFIYVILEYAPALVVVLLLQIRDYVRTRRTAPLWIGGGILLSFAAAAIQTLHLAPHPRFNHNDLYHLVQLVAFWGLYRGGRALVDRDVATP